MVKKSLALVLALLLMVVAAGCGKNAPAEGTGGGTAAQSGAAGSTDGGTEAQTPTYEKVDLGPFKLGETAEVGPVAITFNEVGRIDSGAGIPPGYLFVLVNVTVKNNGEAPYTINVTEQFKVGTPEGKDARYNIMASGQRSPRLQGTITKGKEMTGWMGFLAKLGDGTYQLKFSHPDYGTAYWEFELPSM